jgi:KipI family sensor histidine kinase inhibitor
MSERMRFLPAGSDAVLVEFPDLNRTLALFDALQAIPPAGVEEIIPAARTLLFRFDPHLTDRERLANAISSAKVSGGGTSQGEVFDIPVTYDGEDLQEIAGIMGLPEAEVIRRHTEATYTVAFTGFAPGFAYMTCDDPAFDVPRRQSPRTRIPAGSVALAGRFGGIYPSESPGGWQLIGRTPLAMWDLNRPRAALLTPGDRVRFRDMARGATVPVMERTAQTPKPQADPDPGLQVIRADRPALFQDLGREGRAGQGVSASGALDRAGLVEANLCLGNPRGAPVLEIAYGGFALKAGCPVTLAVTGAPCPLTIVATDGKRLAAPFARPFALDAGEMLTLDAPSAGTRSYLALRGGFAVETILGSASTDTLAKVGPSVIGAGDILTPARAPATAVDPFLPAPPDLPKAGDRVKLDVLPGPRADWFTPEAITTLLSQDWQVTSETSRVGARLAGAMPLERCDATELASEGTPLGAIQVPHSGQPVLFLADHPLTGGYPVIAVVAAHHLDLAGQIPIGAKIRFNAIAAFDPPTRDVSP